MQESVTDPLLPSLTLQDIAQRPIGWLSRRTVLTIFSDLANMQERRLRVYTCHLRLHHFLRAIAG